MHTAGLEEETLGEMHLKKGPLSSSYEVHSMKCNTALNAHII